MLVSFVVVAICFAKFILFVFAWKGECFAPHSCGSKRAAGFNTNLVRSTLLHLRLRGALRANLGGPPAPGLFRLWTNVCGIKSSSRNKISTLSKVSNYEKSDGVHDFSFATRELLRRDHLVRSTLLHLRLRGALRAILGVLLRHFLFVFEPMFVASKAAP